MASTSIQLTDLDDACIQAVFSFLHPLPDLFNVAASCRVTFLPFFGGLHGPACLKGLSLVAR